MPSKKIATELSCTDCGAKKIIQCLVNRDYDQYKCRSCAIKNKWTDAEYRENRPKRQPRKRAAGVSEFGSEEHRRKISESRKGKKLSESTKLKLSISSSIKWQDADYRTRWKERNDSNEIRSKLRERWTEEYRSRYKTEDFKLRQSVASKKLWQSEEYRKKVLDSKKTDKHKALMAKIQQSEEYIRKLSAAYLRMPCISGIQRTLFKILDDLNIGYYDEERSPDQCLIGPWSFDCVIPANDQHKTILIECQGDWIHSLPHKKTSDKAKATYISQYHSDKELKYLWEHQFSSYNCVVNLLKTWLKITDHEIIDFEFNEVTIKECRAVDYRPFLQAYHYLPNAGRGGHVMGAFLHDTLIGVCVLSPLPRQNIKVREFAQAETKELSRFCIHPKYQKKNFGSWFISKCIKSLPKNIKAILSYSDHTFNHHGALYRASNFKLEGTTRPDYWYQNQEGWVMHKKTLYNKAVNLKLTEKEFAERYGYYKVEGMAKSKYVYIR